MQEPTRWPLSARANITIGRYDRSVDDRPGAPGAARAGDAHDFVMELARKYDTLLSRHFTDGADLSGGQWQRLAVSRAFYRDAPAADLRRADGQPGRPGRARRLPAGSASWRPAARSC